MSGGTTKNNRRPARTNMNTLTLFKKVKAFVLDVDGVLTDGGLLLLDDGQQARTMYIRDGYALQLAVQRGYLVLVISGGESAAVRNRLNKLGVSDVHMAVIDKTAILRSFMQRHGLVTEQVLYMGDDMPDLKVMQLAGIPACPHDAAPEIREISKYISPCPGGRGCVRDVIEKVLKLNGHWDEEGSIPAR